VGGFGHFPAEECMDHGSMNGNIIAEGPLMAMKSLLSKSVSKSIYKATEIKN